MDPDQAAPYGLQILTVDDKGDNFSHGHIRPVKQKI